MEQAHPDWYRRLEEKIHEAERPWAHDAAQRAIVGTPGASSPSATRRSSGPAPTWPPEQRVPEDFLFSAVSTCSSARTAKKGPDGAYTAVEPAEWRSAARQHRRHRRDPAHRPHRRPWTRTTPRGLVIDWRVARRPFYRSTPVDPGRVVCCRVIRSKRGGVSSVSRTTSCGPRSGASPGRRGAGRGRRRRPDGRPLDQGSARTPCGTSWLHPGRAGPGDPRARRLLGDVRRGRPRHRQDPPSLLHRAACLLSHQDRCAGTRAASSSSRRTPLPVASHRGRAALPSARRARSPSALIGSLTEGAEATPVRLPGDRPRQGLLPHAQGAAPAARGALEPASRPPCCGSSPSAGALELEAEELAWHPPHRVLGGTAPRQPVLRPRARWLFLDALWG